ncbi:hypothetical protein N3K66_005881 [Trichothecium roseum]|uniref:Uncharacterized protein n=1 Tax=Trichothecium roseum TaxID=47278 RepID=A0ACC0V1T1_9HYPO|nr:hypothetical protein N3K66_005881 [Trichothecium roseum]
MAPPTFKDSLTDATVYVTLHIPRYTYTRLKLNPTGRRPSEQYPPHLLPHITLSTYVAETRDARHYEDFNWGIYYHNSDGYGWWLYPQRQMAFPSRPCPPTFMMISEFPTCPRTDPRIVCMIAMISMPPKSSLAIGFGTFLKRLVPESATSGDSSFDWVAGVVASGGRHVTQEAEMPYDQRSFNSAVFLRECLGHAYTHVHKDLDPNVGCPLFRSQFFVDARHHESGQTHQDIIHEAMFTILHRNIAEGRSGAPSSPPPLASALMNLGSSDPFVSTPEKSQNSGPPSFAPPGPQSTKKGKEVARDQGVNLEAPASGNAPPASDQSSGEGKNRVGHSSQLSGECGSSSGQGQNAPAMVKFLDDTMNSSKRLEKRYEEARSFLAGLNIDPYVVTKELQAERLLPQPGKDSHAGAGPQARQAPGAKKHAAPNPIGESRRGKGSQPTTHLTRSQRRARAKAPHKFLQGPSRVPAKQVSSQVPPWTMEASGNNAGASSTAAAPGNQQAYGESGHTTKHQANVGSGTYIPAPGQNNLQNPQTGHAMPQEMSSYTQTAGFAGPSSNQQVQAYHPQAQQASQQGHVQPDSNQGRAEMRMLFAGYPLVDTFSTAGNVSVGQLHESSGGHGNASSQPAFGPANFQQPYRLSMPAGPPHPLNVTSDFSSSPQFGSPGYHRRVPPPPGLQIPGPAGSLGHQPQLLENQTQPSENQIIQVAPKAFDLSDDVNHPMVSEAQSTTRDLNAEAPEFRSSNPDVDVTALGGAGSKIILRSASGSTKVHKVIFDDENFPPLPGHSAKE